jgi:hypothetical protein
MMKSKDAKGMKGMKGKMAHGRSEMAALQRGKASKPVMANERAEYGMKSGGMVKGKSAKATKC